MSADEAVLICEPEEKEAAVIRDILTVDGFRVTSTSTAADAAQAMRRACSLSEEERTAMARRAREHVRRHFSQEVERARLVELLTP